MSEAETCRDSEQQRMPRSKPKPPDVDSAGVYFVPVDVFEWRPGREAGAKDSTRVTDESD